jgi:hypothetical protein
MEYDVIGDIHGQAAKLHALLRHMGYVSRDGAYRHPERQAVFVGDLIDRGPGQLETIDVVRRMVDAGSARTIMGNHEFNAIAWFTEDPLESGNHLRTRSGDLGKRHRSQHAVFLAEVEHNPPLHAGLIAWFMTLPLWLDLPEIRVVHACWHEGYMRELVPSLTADNQLTAATVLAASRPGTMEFRTVEGLTKGLGTELPEGHAYLDADGHERRNQRIAWWDTKGSTYRDLVVGDEKYRSDLPALPIFPDIRPAYDNLKPVFFGHYWMTGQPVLQSPLMACVDYSAARDGSLVAYRWSGEPRLVASNFAKVG